MTLNEIFRRSGEPTYYTPMAVVGQLVNQEGGTVTIINPPFGEVREPAHRVHRKNWKRMWRLWPGMYLTLSSCRTKLRLTPSNHADKQHEVMKLAKMRRDMYEAQQGVCPHCGKQFDFKWMEMHHVLPWARFNELRYKRENMLLLCHDCHKDIHCDPYLNIRLMESKAKELGINLNEKYKTDESTTNQEG